MTLTSQLSGVRAITIFMRSTSEFSDYAHWRLRGRRLEFSARVGAAVFFRTRSGTTAGGVGARRARSTGYVFYRSMLAEQAFVVIAAAVGIAPGKHPECKGKGRVPMHHGLRGKECPRSGGYGRHVA